MSVQNKVTLVIGGCRSGKSQTALDLANAAGKGKKYFIASSVPTDEEMEKRVKKHQLERGKDWHTIEEPLLIHNAIETCFPDAGVVLVDCLTLWVSNMMLNQYDENKIQSAVLTLEQTIEKAVCPVFLVSNEVGMGIVPENLLARQFRDFAGFVNRRVAAAAHRVIMTVAGIAVQIKP